MLIINNFLERLFPQNDRRTLMLTMDIKSLAVCIVIKPDTLEAAASIK